MRITTSTLMSTVIVSGIFLLLYYLLLILYRLFFHPLKHFPGPRLAAATTLYRAWYQIVHDGGQFRQWTKLHEIYGEVVRISPNQLHFSNPKVFEELTGFASQFVKDEEFWYFTGQSDALLGMSNEKRHKERFKLVASLFAPNGVKGLESTSWDNALRLCHLLSQAAGRPVNMAMACRALMLDNVLDFVFDEAPKSLRGLQDLSFSSQYLLTTYYWMDWTGTWPRRNFPRLLSLFTSLVPDRLYQALLPGDYTMGKFYKVTSDTVQQQLMKPKCIRDTFLGRFPKGSTLEYLTLECTATILGGIVDPTNVLQYGLFHISIDEALQEALYHEVESIWAGTSSGMPDVSALQGLPLLTGVIMESLRLTHGFISGPPRTAPTSGASLGGVPIPKGASVITSSYYPHMNAAVFSNPEAFMPSRWSNATQEMTRSISSFSKGRRQCPARQMAMNQLYISFAALLHHFRFEPHQTCLQDFDTKAYWSVHFTGRQFQAKAHLRRESQK